MTKEELQRVRDWAQQKLAQGEEPPWAWFQFMKLREVLDQMLAGMDATQTASSLEFEQHRGKHLRLVGSTDQQDTAQRHSDILPVQLPT